MILEYESSAFHGPWYLGNVTPRHQIDSERLLTQLVRSQGRLTKAAAPEVLNYHDYAFKISWKIHFPCRLSREVFWIHYHKRMEAK